MSVTNDVIDVVETPRVSIIRVLQCLLDAILVTALSFSLKDPYIPSARLTLLNEEWAGFSDRKDHEISERKCE
jgi:hypothetical protein